MPRILISERMESCAQDVLREKGIPFDVRIGLSSEDLQKIMPDYDGLIIRSGVRVTPAFLDAAPRLKVVGRAGVGLDNVNVQAATERGVLVMNTPHANVVSTAEHTVAMLMAVARNLPGASVSTKSGFWDREKWTGVQISGKTLGLVGCGNIGSMVAARARALSMRVIVHDLFLTEEKAASLGVEKVPFETLLSDSDFISLNLPLTESTRGMVNADTLARMKRGVRLVNCARGGIVVEKDLIDALKSGHVACAAVDVFEDEPVLDLTTFDSPLFALENVICTPHLGSCTIEAQENVARSVASQVADYLLSGTITNAVNAAAIASAANLSTPDRERGAA